LSFQLAWNLSEGLRTSRNDGHLCPFAGLLVIHTFYKEALETLHQQIRADKAGPINGMMSLLLKMPY